MNLCRPCETNFVYLTGFRLKIEEIPYDRGAKNHCLIARNCVGRGIKAILRGNILAVTSKWLNKPTQCLTLQLISFAHAACQGFPNSCNKVRFAMKSYRLFCFYRYLYFYVVRRTRICSMPKCIQCNHFAQKS